jgi:hypothetical protein
MTTRTITTTTMTTTTTVIIKTVKTVVGRKPPYVLYLLQTCYINILFATIQPKRIILEAEFFGNILLSVFHGYVSIFDTPLLPDII